MLCPCWSQIPYSECCAPYHKGVALPEHALKLMRSRYSAYALKEADYLMDTTHPDHPSYSNDRVSWRISLLQFANETSFDGLEIISFQDGPREAFVTFLAKLSQGGQDTSFQEKSRFVKVDGKWLYHSMI